MKKKQSLWNVIALIIAILAISLGPSACGNAGGGTKHHNTPPGGNTPTDQITMQIVVDPSLAAAESQKVITNGDLEVVEDSEQLKMYQLQSYDGKRLFPNSVKLPNGKIRMWVDTNAPKLDISDIDTVKYDDYYTDQLEVNPKNPKEANFRALMVTPGGNQIWLFGTVINRTAYWPAAAVDYTAQVVGGVLTVTFYLPVGTYLHIADALGNPTTGLEIRVDNISFNNGEYPSPTNPGTYKILGTSPNQYPVMCVIANRDQSANVTVTGNPNCTDPINQLVVEVDGNATIDEFDDPIPGGLPYTTPPRAGQEVRWQASLWQSTAIWPNMSWDAARNLYSATFHSVGANQGFWIEVARPSRDVTAPAGTFEPELGGVRVYVKTMAGVDVCNAELHHIEDIDPSAGYWYAFIVNGTACPVPQGAPNRDIATQGP